MNNYSVLADYYDRFTDDVPYQRWAEYLEQIFAKEKLRPKLVLDLACGTGTLTRLLSQKGYEMIGVDLSSEMLAQAANKCAGLLRPPLFLNQSMDKLDLYGTVDACISSLDSVNYITDPNILQKAFQRVHLFLEPGGIFVFDIHTAEKLEKLHGQSFVREDDEVYCSWQIKISDGGLCTYSFDIFENAGNHLWRRYQEMHQERIYTKEAICIYLKNAGFQTIRIYPELSFDPLTGTEERLFFTARKNMENKEDG